MTPDELDAIRRSGDLYALGVRPSGVSDRDYVVAPPAPAAAPPSFTHSAVRKVPVKDQQGGTCVGNSIALCMTYLEWAEKGDVVSFDGEALNMRVVGRDYGEGAAASPHDVLEDIRLHGAQGPTGLYFPKGYAWLDWHDHEAVRAAMSTPGQMVTASVWLTRAFDEAADDKTFAREDPALNSWGYHQLTFVGYEDRGVLVQNSWGTWWGDAGFVRLGWDYVDARLGECWAVTDNADTVKEGFVRTHDYGAGAETAIARYDLPTRKRPAVYLIKPNGRIWIKDPFEARRMGVALPPVRVPDTDKRWDLPVIGPDAPRDLR